MTCTTFREQHAALLDDVLDEQAIVAMQCHLAECAPCAAHDRRVRRAQALFHAVPEIAPSADFGARLNARLNEERRAAARASLLASTVAGRGPGLGVFAAAAASVAAMAYLAAATVAASGAQREPTLPPVVASRVAEPPAAPRAVAAPALPDPALLASVSMGMPIWPTAVMADEASLNFATSEFQLASFGR